MPTKRCKWSRKQTKTCAEEILPALPVRFLQDLRSFTSPSSNMWACHTKQINVSPWCNVFDNLHNGPPDKVSCIYSYLPLIRIHQWSARLNVTLKPTEIHYKVKVKKLYRTGICCKGLSITMSGCIIFFSCRIHNRHV